MGAGAVTTIGEAAARAVLGGSALKGGAALGVALLTTAAPGAERVWLGPSSLDAQVAGVDATLATKYLWRGLTRANDAVFQVGLYAGVEIGTGFLAAEFWNHTELAGAGPDDLTDAGTGSGGWTEQDVSVRYVWEIGEAVAGLGWVKYRFLGDPGAGGRGPEDDTEEVFGSLEWRGLEFFVPRVSVWHDYDRVNGTYVETGGSFRIPVTSLGAEISLYVDTLLGLSLGQERGDGSAFYFDARGPTHVAVAPAFVARLDTLLERLFHSLSTPGLTVILEPLRFQRHLDLETRRMSARAVDQNREVSWGPSRLTLSVSTP